MVNAQNTCPCLKCSFGGAAKEICVAKVFSSDGVGFRRGKAERQDVEHFVVVPTLGQHKAVLCVEPGVELGLGHVQFNHAARVLQVVAAILKLCQHTQHYHIVQSNNST